MTFKHEARRPSTAWIVVADRARARVFAGEWPELEDFREIEGFVHPEGAAHPRDVETDSPGRFYESQGPKHAAEPQTDFKHRTAVEFAREIVRELQRGKDENTFGRLIIIAPALFLGVLREQLPDPLSRLIVADLDKDLTHLDANAVRAEIRKLSITKEAPAGGRAVHGESSNPEAAHHSNP